MPESGFITKERVRILYENALASNLTIAVSVPIMVYLFWGRFPNLVPIGWGIFMIMTVGIRQFFLLNYNKTKNITENHQIFEIRYTWICALLGLGWSFLVAWGLTLPIFEHRMYSILLVTAVIAISVPMFSSSLKLMYLYILPSVGLATPMLLYRGGNDAVLGLALVIFTYMMLRSGRSVYSTMIHTLELQSQAKAQSREYAQLHLEKEKSEQRIQHILDYTPTAIYVKDLKGRYTLLNKKVAQLHNVEIQTTLGKNLFDIFPEDIAKAIQKNDLEAIEKQKVIEFEESSYVDGELHHFISVKFPLFDDEGEIYALGGIATDITDRVKAEESLKLSQQRLLLHREQSPVGIIEWNTNFELIEWNPAAQKIFGYSTDEILGRHITDTILPKSAEEAVKKVWQGLLNKTGGRHSINENMTKDGRTILCEWHNTPLIDDEGNVIGVTSLVEDITEKEKNETNLRHNQKMDAIGKLTGGIAHDFNNMLAVILGFSELIEKNISSENPKLHKYNSQINKAAERAKSLTSKLLDFSRKTPSSSEKTDINQLLSDSRHMLEKTLTPRISLSLNFETFIWSIYVDKSRLEDAILNICINAMHAMPEGGTLNLITRNTTLSNSEINSMDIKAGEYVELTIADSGIGMDEQLQQKIFDPFFTTKDTQGTGLGLSQVYGFVKQSQGGITVTSELGEGTQFSLYFPRYRESETNG